MILDNLISPKLLKMKHKRRISWAAAAGVAGFAANFVQLETIFVLLAVGVFALFLNYKVLMLSSFVCCIGLCEQLRHEEKNHRLSQQNDNDAKENTGCEVLRTAAVSFSQSKESR